MCVRHDAGENRLRTINVLMTGLLFGIGYMPVLFAQDQKGSCLNGYELTAIVVMETDIRQSVESYACRMALPGDTSTYDLYNQLRDKWSKQRTKQRKLRDEVYQRIYGDAWQTKVDEWRQSMAVTKSKAFRPSEISCQDLRNELGSHAHDWQTLYQASAREAASAKYDPLRCETTSVIRIRQ